jgi:hypothetical protein
MSNFKAQGSNQIQNQKDPNKESFGVNLIWHWFDIWILTFELF